MDKYIVRPKTVRQQQKEKTITGALMAIDDLADTVGRVDLVIDDRISVVIDNAIDYRYRYTISTIGKPESLVVADTFNRALEILINRLVYGG